jgi:hypothetical protein
LGRDYGSPFMIPPSITDAKKLAAELRSRGFTTA